MSLKDFDPYYKWLSIPPAEQPADHYRLLGLARHEADPDVIQHAADSRMAFLKTFQSGAHARESQEMLSHVARAQSCLLNPATKRDYDAALRMGVSRFDNPELTRAVTSAPNLDLASPIASVSARSSRRVAPKNHLVRIVIGGLVGIGLGYLIVTHVLGLSYFPLPTPSAAPAVIAPAKTRVADAPITRTPVVEKPTSATVKHPFRTGIAEPPRETPDRIASPAAVSQPVHLDDAAVSQAIGLPLEVHGPDDVAAAKKLLEAELKKAKPPKPPKRPLKPATKSRKSSP